MDRLAALRQLVGHLPFGHGDQVGFHCGLQVEGQPSTTVGLGAASTLAGTASAAAAASAMTGADLRA